MKLHRPSQREMYYQARAGSAAGDQTMLDLMYGPNPITRDELARLIRKRPEMYGRYVGYLKHLKRRPPRYTRHARSR